MNYYSQESERLIFRKLTEEDIPTWVEFFEDNDRLPFLGIDDLSKGKEVLAKEWVMAQFKRYKTQGLGHLAVELKASGKFIGMGGILPRDLEGKKEYEVSYSLMPAFWGKGYGTEMAIQLKKFGWANINTTRFISIIHIENAASINIAQKNGMEVLFNTNFLGMNVYVYGTVSEDT
jgi:ribosomal-protein-alanine N-acetyltransferase